MGFLRTDRSRQLQAVDNLSYNIRAHQLKFGADYRWLSPEETTGPLLAVRSFSGLFGTTGAAYSGVFTSALFGYSNIPNTAFVDKAFSAYAQDTWKASRRLTLTYGLRWEVDPSPRVSARGRLRSAPKAQIQTTFPGVAALVPAGKPFYPTSWSNLAPRLGIAWQMLDRPKSKTVLRVGAGQFFDLGQDSLEGNGFQGDAISEYAYQPLASFTGGILVNKTTVPLSLYDQSSLNVLFVARGFKLPYTWEWNATLEQAIGQQTFSIGYIGALGRRLVGWTRIVSDGNEFLTLNNDTSSSYHALQLQFNRRLSTRLHLLVSYTWAHSIDDLSNGQPYDTALYPFQNYVDPRAWGSSDFDIRQSLNGSVIAALPSPHTGIAAALFRNWTANSIFFARSALPTDLYVGSPFVRPNRVPREPLYLYGREFPGGKSFNLAAFAAPPGALTAAEQQGDLGRNVLRGLGAWEIDFAIHREYPLSEGVTLQFRAEAFNLLNHPNFANPSNSDDPGALTIASGVPWGAATQTLANGLSPSGVVGQLSPLFQIGGPRTLQLALRLYF